MYGLHLQFCSISIAYPWYCFFFWNVICGIFTVIKYPNLCVRNTAANDRLDMDSVTLEWDYRLISSRNNRFALILSWVVCSSNVFITGPQPETRCSDIASFGFFLNRNSFKWNTRRKVKKIAQLIVGMWHWSDNQQSSLALFCVGTG